MFKRIVLFGLAALFYAAQSPSFAESYDVVQQQRMENEINALRNFVVDLEERIKQLEREQTGKAWSRRFPRTSLPALILEKSDQTQ